MDYKLEGKKTLFVPQVAFGITFYHSYRNPNQHRGNPRTVRKKHPFVVRFLPLPPPPPQPPHPPGPCTFSSHLVTGADVTEGRTLFLPVWSQRARVGSLDQPSGTLGLAWLKSVLSKTIILLIFNFILIVTCPCMLTYKI